MLMCTSLPHGKHGSSTVTVTILLVLLGWVGYFWASLPNIFFQWPWGW